MIVEYLLVAGLRNISRIELDAHPKINWLTGANGAGKTSILEALYLLARGRSFRGPRHGPLIGIHQSRLELSARLRSPCSADVLALCNSLHYVLTPHQALLKENGQVVGRVQDLRTPLHVRVIADNAQRLLEGPPEMRRLFLDWNLFHVEPAYGRLIGQFRRVHSQRNAWLRSGGRGPRVWDREYCHLAEKVTLARHRIVAGIEEGLSAMVDCVGYADSLEIRFLPGWDTSQSLEEILNRNLHEDLHRGYTRFGPARADFLILQGDSCFLPSRGQIKALACLLQMAAQRYTVRQGKLVCVWLVDDLAAELDAKTQNRIMAALCDLGGQIFVTSMSTWGPSPCGLEGGLMFHVEQGRIVQGEDLGLEVAER